MSIRSHLLLPFLLIPAVFTAPLSGDEEEPEPWEEDVLEMEREWEELERELEALLDAEPPVWMPLFSLQGGLGYNDNVLQSSISREEGFFLHTGLDFMLQRNPRAEGPQFHLFLLGENRHYFSNGDLNDERLISLHAETVSELGPKWSVVLPFGAYYHDEVTDVSTREADLGTVRLRGVGLRSEPALRFEPSERDRIEGKLIGRRLFLRRPLDDFREIGLGVSWKHNATPDSTLDLEVRTIHRRYGTREALDSDGSPIDGRRREFLIQRFDGTLRYFWDEEQKWQSRFGAGLEINRDNGGGFFNFYRPMASHRLIYRHAPWQVEAGARVSHYLYRERTLDNGSKLHRTAVDVNTRGSFELTTRLQLFAEYRHDNVITNETAADYRVNTALLGAEWTF